MTTEQLWETFRVFDAIEKISHEADIQNGVVNLKMTDAKHGNFIVRTLTTVPTSDEAKAIIAEMKKEMKSRAKKMVARVAGEQSANAS